VDRFNRRVSYLRLSVTDRCNLRCRYCAPALPEPLAAHKLLTLSEMERLVRIGTELGIRKVRLTGGEPLCRKGLAGFVETLSALPRLREVSLTTNGTLLTRHAEDLKRAGLGRINISLDTLDRRKYQRLTGADRFDAVWRGIMQAAELGLDPLKINVVVMKGFNGDELEAMARLSLRYPFHVRFIEYMPIGTDPHRAQSHFLSVAEMRRRLKRMGTLLPVAGGLDDGPAQRYRFEGAPGEIGLIGSMSSHFCHTCNRLRLTADGRLRPCLLAEETVDLFGALRTKASDEALAARFVEAVRRKRGRHRMDFTRDRVLLTKMVSIGG
jgi:cyclic pyranopterin phosphate synthase